MRMQRSTNNPTKRTPTRRRTLSTVTIAPTIERNEVHNYWTAAMSDSWATECCDAVDGLEDVRAMAHALAEALPDEPEDKPDPDKVRELTSRTLDVWRGSQDADHRRRSRRGAVHGANRPRNSAGNPG